MAPLLGVPYRLYALQAQTEARTAANCLTAVVFALRQSGLQCAALTPQQAWAFWRPLSKPLHLGKTRIPPRGLLLFTRDHFLLLHEDVDGNGVVGLDDRVIHAPYRPVEITQLRAWLHDRTPAGDVRAVPMGASFRCATPAELARLPRRSHQHPGRG